MKTEFEGPIGTELYVVNTGSWRTHRPVTDRDLCSQCGICYLYCPTGTIHKIDGEYQIDLPFCKGCGICANECARKAIRMVEEG